MQTVDHFGECGNQFAGALERLRNQVRGNLRVGFAGKFGFGGKQFGLEFGKIFDDAVVNQRQPGCLAAKVRVCIAVGGCAVGCPTGVANADMGGWQWVCLNLGHQIIELSSLFAGLELPVCDYRYPGRIVASVFESTKPADQNLEG